MIINNLVYKPQKRKGENDMVVLKCKMCGGDLIPFEGSKICECEYCGSRQTIPAIKEEGIQTLFNRANTLRMKAEFDKAADIYEKILQRNEEEAEAYWGLILCKYGIEYVEDPVTFKHVPTCHRASYDAVTADEDYKNAIKYADEEQRVLYEEQGKEIEEIQRQIVDLSRKEAPYDVFICYKETDGNGKRTPDSVIANDIYYQLTHEGFKVFYSAITLESKLGAEYEPYIFSALNSAKVMLTIGTKPEYFRAVWVKNEWSRFLKLMKKDRTRLLIPCYKDMDPYDLPQEFAHLQAQDMGKIGFINDLIRGIKKVISNDIHTGKNVSYQEQVTGNYSNAAALLKRGMIALEDKEWSKADGFFEEVLNQDPESSEAYIGKLLAANKLSTFSQYISFLITKYQKGEFKTLTACPEATEYIAKVCSEYELKGYLDQETIKKVYFYDRTYSSDLSCRKEQKTKQLEELKMERHLARAIQFAQGDEKKKIEQGIGKVISALDQRINDSESADKEKTEIIQNQYREHIEKADLSVKNLREKAEQEKERDYLSCISEIKKATDIPSYQKAIIHLEDFVGYKDSETQLEYCRREISRLEKEKEEEHKRRDAERKRLEIERKHKNKIWGIITVCVAVAVVAVFFVVTKVIIPNHKYNSAVGMMETGEYDSALKIFEELGRFKDSNTQVIECKYCSAVKMLENGEYESALNIFEEIENFKDSDEKIAECVKAQIRDATVGDIVRLGHYEQDNDDSNGSEKIEWLILADEEDRKLLITKYGIDCKQFNDKKFDATWATCTLRKWLNDDFYNQAFEDTEKDMILTSVVLPIQYEPYTQETDQGDETQDKVFILSIQEAMDYFKNNTERKAKGTKYAEEHGATSPKDDGSNFWWLRTIKIGKYSVNDEVSGSCVNRDGEITIGTTIDFEEFTVRPAIWVEIR